MSKPYQVIGISGKAGTGKDWIVQNILRPNGYFQFSLSWHFKIGIVGENKGTYEEVFFTKPPHVRQALQLKGTEEGRNVFGDDIWCKHAEAWMDTIHQHAGISKFVIADIRFPNEKAWVESLGGKVLRIIAPQREAANGLSATARAHESETALDGVTDDEFDGIIQNDPQYKLSVRHQVCTLLGLPMDMTIEDGGLSDIVGDFTGNVVGGLMGTAVDVAIDPFYIRIRKMFKK